MQKMEPLELWLAAYLAPFVKHPTHLASYRSFRYLYYCCNIWVKMDARTPQCTRGQRTTLGDRSLFPHVSHELNSSSEVCTASTPICGVISLEDSIFFIFKTVIFSFLFRCMYVCTTCVPGIHKGGFDKGGVRTTEAGV